MSSKNNDVDGSHKGRAVTILDGGLATALEARGLDLKSELWSARILQDDPESIYNVHLDYFNAGADVAITASYQASTICLEKYLALDEKQSANLIQHSVKLAQRARDKVLENDATRSLLVAGSVGPYGAYLANGAEYTGDYRLSPQEMKDFHRSRIHALLDAGADLLACETMPSMPEIEALLDLLKNEFPQSKAWLSCTLRDEGHLSDGSSVEELAKITEHNTQIVAIGYNCIPEQLASPALDHLRTLTTKPLIIYPNSGEQYNATKKTWYGKKAQGNDLSHAAKDWYEKGARFIGGCCRTNAADIKVIGAAF